MKFSAVLGKKLLTSFYHLGMVTEIMIINIMSGHPTKNIPIQSVQMNIYQSNPNRKILGWIHFGKEPRVQEKQ